MIIKNLKLTGFRNHKNFETDFASGVTLILGSNGSGKTNVLEAVNLLSTGKSFKARFDHEMIYNPNIAGPGDVFDGNIELRDFSKITADVAENNNEETLEVIVIKRSPETNISHKSYKINGALKHIYDSADYFNCVLFTPQDLELFTGGPALRRKLLDDILYKIDKKYKRNHALYIKAIRQRNKILEKINKTALGLDELPYWTEKILDSGSYIQEKRAELISLLNSDGGQSHEGQIDYKMNEISVERLSKHHEHEILARSTLVGPHRDDFEFKLNGYNIALYGSRGQQRTAILALKMSELDVVHKMTSSRPVLLLDDIFSELDDVHKKALEDVIYKQQTIITTTKPPDYLHSAGNMQILL